MGNTAICKNAPCTTTPKPVYKTVLSQIFQIAWEKSNLENSTTKSFSADNTETTIKLPSDNVDVPKLEAHVKSHIKALIDYLEGSHKKLIDTGNYLQKVVTGSYNPNIHMLGLLTIIELVNASSKFTHDKNFLQKLRQRGKTELTEENGKGNQRENLPSEQNKGLDSSLLEESAYQAYKDNIIQFENMVIEIVIFLLDPKMDTLQKPVFKHVLKTFDLYMRNNVGNISSDKLETIIDRFLAIIESYQNFTSKEDLEVQIQFTALLILVSTKYQIAFKFKLKFISQSCNTLKNLYEIRQNTSSYESIPTEIKNLMSELGKSSFSLIEIVTQSVFDLNEFGVLITPLFAFFDNTEWKNTQLQLDIFMSIMESMNNSSFEQVEIFMIDKIVEYIDYDKYNKIVINPYKHNQEIHVKIRVFSLLAKIFEKTKKTFLSFLVIDNIILSIMNNLKHLKTSKSEAEADQFREAIYNTQKQFIEKLNSSSKNLSELIDSIVAQIFHANMKETRDEQFITEVLRFYEFTIDTIACFPSQYVVSRECISLFLKIRGHQQLAPRTYRPVEKLLSLKFQQDETANVRDFTGRKSDLLVCPPDVAFNLLSNILNSWKNIDENSKENTSSQTYKTYVYLTKHCVEVCESLLNRRDALLLVILVSFIKKIMALSRKENIQNQYKGLLIYITVRFLQKLEASWGVSLAPKISVLSKTLPLEAVNTLENSQNLSSIEVESISSAFEKAIYTNPHEQQTEYEAILHSIANTLKSTHPNLNFEYLNEDFDDLGSIYNGNAFASVGEIEMSVEHNRSHLADGTPRHGHGQGQGLHFNQFTRKSAGGNAGKGDSLLSIHQVQHNGNNSVLKSSFILKPEDNVQDDKTHSYIDQSFENALKEARKTVKPNNLSKILNNQI